MIIDMHAHLWQAAIQENKIELLTAMNRYKIDKTFVSGLFGGYYPNEDDIKNANEAVYKFTEEYPSKIYGYVYVNPSHSNAKEVLEDGLRRKNIVGMKLWVATLCDDERVFPLAEICIKYNKPILIHSSKKAVGQIETECLGKNIRNLALKYPKCNLVMAHLGGIYVDGINSCKDLPNVYYDFSGSTNERDALIYTLKNVSHDKIMFGTDAPLCYISTLSQIEELNLNKELKDKIYYKNAENLFLGGHEDE